MAKILKPDGETAGEISVPTVFDGPVRLDTIRKAVLAQQSHLFQRQGRNRMAGKRTTAEGFGVGRGISRVPRIGGHGPLSGQAAFAPGTRGGRLAFPPLSSAIPVKRINRKERRLALRSAIAATVSRETVTKRGHRFVSELEFPLVVTDEVEKFAKASEAKKFLAALGLWDEITRVSRTQQSWGTYTKHSVGPLLVVGESKSARRAFRNFVGVDVVRVQDLSVGDLAPGTHPGRLTVWTESAVKTLAGKNW
jgi:large subunit ribosomal protein L4e